MTSWPVSVTTISSSMRAALQPSVAGQNVSSANTIPGLISWGWSSETSRLIIGFSQMARPMPWPICSANADSSSGKPNSVAFGHTDATSAVDRARANQLDRGVEVIAAPLVGVDQRARRRADGEAPVIAGAVSHVGVEDVVEHRVAGPHHAIGEHVRMRAAALARDRVHALRRIPSPFRRASWRRARPRRSRACRASSPCRARSTRRPPCLAECVSSEISSCVLISRASDISCWPSTMLRPSFWSANSTGGSTTSTPTGSLCRPALLELDADLAGDVLGPAHLGRHRAAHQRDAGARPLAQPVAVELVMLGGGAEVPEDRLVVLRQQREAADLVLRPRADVRGRDVAHVVHVEAEHRAELRFGQQLLDARQALAGAAGRSRSAAPSRPPSFRMF